VLETLPKLHKLENVEHFKGNRVVELPLEVLSTVDCLTGIFGKVTADAVAKELAVVDRLGKLAPKRCHMRRLQCLFWSSGMVEVVGLEYG
jgi:hypothetical protein